MGIFDFGKRKNVQPVTKSPQFVITDFFKNNLFEGLVDDKNYLDQALLYTNRAIEYIAENVADKEPHLYIKEGQSQKRKKLLTKNNDYSELDDKNDLYNDLLMFNPHMTLYEARKLKEMHLRFTGSAFWFVSREDLAEGFRKAEFYPLDPTKIDVITDNFGLPRAFRYYDGNGEEQILEKDNVIYFRRTNMKNWIKGQSQLEPIKFLHNAYLYATQHNMNTFLNNARPDFLLSIPDLTEEQREGLETQMKNRYGGANNAGKGGVIDSEAKILEFSRSQKDLDYVKGMELMRDDILALFGIPTALLFPSATNANTEEARKIFQRDVLQPALKQEASILNEQLISKYYLGARYQEVSKYYFEFVNIVDTNQKEQLEYLEIGVRSGILQVNEARDELGLEPLDDVAEEPKEEPEKPAEDMEEVKAMIKTLEAKIDKKKGIDPMQKEIETAIKESERFELQSRETTKNWFISQATRLITSYDQIPTVKNAMDLAKENELGINAFKPLVDAIASEANQTATVEVRSKMFARNNPNFSLMKHKSITPEMLGVLDKMTSFFVNEINDVTRKQLRKAISNAVKNDLTSLQFKRNVADIFNGYLEGQGNIDILNKYGVYETLITVTEEGGVIIGSNNRYNRMLENITNRLTGDDQQKALVALKGALDPTDPIARQVDLLLTNIYNIKEIDAITDYRAMRIARSMSTGVKNYVFREQYENNPFVKGLTWVSVFQPGVTRDSHLRANGQTVPKGQSFIVGGQKMEFPGDPNASVEEVVNCRCRVIAEV